MQERSNCMDTLKGILIFSVVLCHLFECINGQVKYQIYMVVYTFHMPLFAFISGCFAKFSMENILKKLVFPYLVFQPLYCLAMGIRVQWIAPAWLMWYMFAMVVWSLTLPLVRRAPRFTLVLSAVLALSIGFWDDCGKWFSLSRVVCFYPYFVLGCVAFRFAKDKKIRLHGSPLGVFLLCLAFVLTYGLVMQLKTAVLYRSMSYSATDGSPAVRFVLFGLAMLWIAGLLLVVPSRRVPILSAVGQNSFCAYLLHGFLVLFIKRAATPFVFTDTQNFLLAAAIAAGLTVVFGNRAARLILRPVTDLSFWFRTFRVSPSVQCRLCKGLWVAAAVFFALQTARFVV